MCTYPASSWDACITLFRYSVCSAVGVLPLALHYGFEVARRFLDGAHDMDNHFLNEPPRQNIPVLMGLLGVWNSTFLGHGARALLPYSQALLRFAAHIQQVCYTRHVCRWGRWKSR